MRNMDEKELRMRAFCYTWKGRLVTFIEIFAMGFVAFALLVDYMLAHEPAFKGHEENLFNVFMVAVCGLWGIICAILCSGGGAPSMVLHRLFYVSPDDIQRYQKWREEP